MPMGIFGVIGFPAKLNLTRFACVVGLFSLAALPCMGQSEQAVKFTAGYALGSDESMFAAGLLRQAAEQVSGVEVAYDQNTTSGYGELGTRFKGSEQLTDIVFLYVGRTEQLDEIAGLARRGLIQPLDTLPGYQESIRPDDIYSNLLRPGKYEGHVWALPVRIGVPCLAVKEEFADAARTWDGLVGLSEQHPLTYSLRSDPYMLWLTLMAQEGLSQFKNGRYDFANPQIAQCFERARALVREERREKWEDCAVGIVSPDALITVPSLREMKLLPLAQGKNDDVFYGEASWYVGVSAQVAGPKRQIIAQLLGAILSPEVQNAMAQRTLSPAVRPSIVKSRQWRTAYGPDTPQGVFGSMVERLRFRQPGDLTAQTEPMIEQAYSEALGNPTAFESIMKDAAAKANTVVSGSTKKEDSP